MEAIRATPTRRARVNVRALRAHLGAILSNVEENGLQVIVTRRSKDIAQIGPVSENTEKTGGKMRK